MPDYVENVHTRATVVAFYRELVLGLQAQYEGEAFKPSLMFLAIEHVREAEAKFNDRHEIRLHPARVEAVIEDERAGVEVTPTGFEDRGGIFHNILLPALETHDARLP